MKAFKTLAEALDYALENYPSQIAYQFREGKNKNFSKMSFSEMKEKTLQLGAGLHQLGLRKGDHVGLVEDVGPNWPLADFAMQFLGIIDVPRGTDSTGEELAWIMNHAECKTVFVRDAKEVPKIEKALTKFPHKVERYIILSGEKPKAEVEVLSLQEVMDLGKEALKDNKLKEEVSKIRFSIEPDDLSTIVYTSGTTGDPKGVMLTHGNFAFNLNAVAGIMEVNPGERGLTLLPPWHVMGRITEYLFFVYGCTLTYTDIKHIGDDLRNVKPHFVPAVPRIWEGVYNKIMAQVKKSGREPLFNFFRDLALEYRRLKNIAEGKVARFEYQDIWTETGEKIVASIGANLMELPRKVADELVFKKVREATGGCLKASISGGGALPDYIDDFFSAIGITILNGYGMTETSPIISGRRPDRNIPGTIGAPIPGTEIKLIDMDGNDVTHIPGAKGTLHVRGPQVMKGYYKNPEKTKEVLSEDGWLNTGDLMTLTVDGELCFVGRSKDTIVLFGGENVEPTPIEEKLKESPYIDHCMVVGQDQKFLGALIVPNEEELLNWAKANGVSGTTLSELIQNPKVEALIKDELKRLVNANPAFKSFEKVPHFRLIGKPFEKGEELNNTLKLRRHVVTEKYKDLINSMYA